MKALVVGAGFAGLAAAEELQRAGVEVEVFEARRRVGGRVWSVPFAGAVAERGAEFIFPDHEEVIASAARLGLRLVRKGTRYGDREPRRGEPVARGEVMAAVARIRAEAPSGRTVAEALAGYGLETRVLEAIRARLEVSCAYTAADLDAQALVEGAGAFGPFDSYGVEGGNGRLAQEMAVRLGGSVRLATPVSKISWSEGEVRVVDRAGRSSRADVAVVAIPAAVIWAIAFDPPLPAAKWAALGSVRYGQAAKLFVALREPAPPSATLSVPERFWCYTQLGPDGNPLSFVTAFAGTLQALESLAVAFGPKRWLTALSRLRPDLELEPDSALLSRWDDDPWAWGAYSATSVASPLDTEELRRPVGPLSFAGEHTAGAWHGLMEGALRSGRRAAQELLQTAAR